MKNAILVDFKAPIDWPFSKELSKNNTEWEVRCCTSNTKLYHTKLGKILRYCLYFGFPLWVIFTCKKYNYVLGWQQFYAINLAFWLKLFHLKKVNKIVIMTFIYKKKKGWIGNLYHQYIKYSISKGCVSVIICHSRSEIAYYTNLFSLPKGIVQFIPIGIDTIDSLNNPNTYSNASSYIFSTGRSNRDYHYLITALTNTNYQLKIACEDNFQGNDHIEIIRNCYGNDMLDLLRKCYCVCIPLKESNISSGQLVVLQAMRFGKPVIITYTDSIVDYVINGYNGFIIENTTEELLAKLSLLYNNPRIYKSMSNNSLSYFYNNFTLSQMAKNISKILH